MPPQSSQNSQYDFILRDPQAPKRKFLPHLPKVARVLIGVVAVMLVIVIAGTLFSSGGSSNSQQLVSVAAHAQEIARVSDLVLKESKDADAQDLAATTQIAMASEAVRLNALLGKAGVKISPAQLAAKRDKNIDAQLKTAAQTNSLDVTYYNYLKSQLADYKSTVEKAFEGSSGESRAILNEAFDSATILLSAQQLS